MHGHTDLDNACPEYQHLSRRGFLQVAGVSAGTAAILSSAPAWLPRVAFAKGDGPTETRDVIVQVYLRGGADGLSMCTPFNDPVYALPTCRPTLRVYAPDDTTQPVGRRAIALSNAQLSSGTSTFNFGLHPAMAALVPAYVDGKLLIVHGTGLTSTNKSHFDAQRWMENGQAQSNSVFTGWLGRHLASTPPVNPSTAIRAIGVADGLQRTLAGSPKALPIPNVQSNPGTPPALNNLAAVSASNSGGYGLTGTSATNVTRINAIESMYASIAREPLASAAQNTVNTIDRLNQIGSGGYAPAGGAAYPTSSLGHALRTSAALIHANDDAGFNQFVEAIAIDVGGWDTHANEFTFNAASGVFTGTMVNNMTTLAQGLGAFYQDVIASRGKRVTVVVISEFGRRVGENGTTGTDHGFGNMMMVLGGAVLGGRVIGTWPGLPSGNLTTLDVPMTTDLRHILAEVVAKRLANAGNLASVFPSFAPQFKGVFA